MYPLTEGNIKEESEKLFQQAHPDCFWIIWCPTSELPPRQPFKSQHQAEKVAALMKEKDPTSNFHVLVSYGKFSY